MFCVGDRVVCIDNRLNEGVLLLNKVYTIKWCGSYHDPFADQHDLCVRVDEVNRLVPFRATRFRLHEEQDEPLPQGFKSFIRKLEQV